MVARINLLRNVGRFDNVAAGAHLPLEKLTVVYAENGRGKTTLAAVLRSLATGEAADINARKRLGAPADPHVVVSLDGGATATFQAGTWSATDPRLAIFDDEFVAENVCQGIAVDASQREALHELIVGAQGVTLSNAVQVHVDRVEEHSRELRTKGAAVPAAARGTLTVDVFCKLQPQPDVDPAIAAVEARLAAAKAAAEIAGAATLPSLSLPAFDPEALGVLLARGLDDLDATAASRVQAHFQKLGSGGERWLGEGVAYAGRLAASGDDSCPFCAQSLSGSAMVEHYRAYFGEAYAQLKQSIADALTANRRTHAGEVPAAFERRVREASEARAFWQRFMPIPALDLDTVAIARAWKAARDGVDALLQRKQAAPLDPVTVPDEVVAALADYGAAVGRVRATDERLAEANIGVARIKAEAGVAQVATLERELAELQTVRARFEPAIAAACQAYIDESAAKKVTEGARDQARAALQTYREAVFPQYRTRANDYLARFNAGFHIGNMEAVNHRGGSSADYNFVVNGSNVGLGSFRTTLSAGDRNTLALAFFFATLDADPAIAEKIVVVDDPMTSLDEHRTLHTVQELHRLAGRVRKVVVLSHSKPFLFGLWVKCSRLARSAIEVRRSGQGSTLVDWNVSEAMTDEVDRLHEKTRAYLADGGDADEMRTVAAGLRHILERFARVSYPANWGPDMKLGGFHLLAVRHLGGPDQILGPNDTAELRQLLDYANRYHHDTNPGGYQTEAVSDAELADFARRTLAFATRRPH